MKPRYNRQLLAPCLLALSLLSTPARALELIPMVGLVAGGEFEDEVTDNAIEIDESASFGLVVAIDSSPGKQYELLFSQQDSELNDSQGVITSPLFDLRMQYLHIGGSYYFEGRSRAFAPYVAGGLGITRIDPRISGGDDEIRPSMNLGLGLSWMPTERFGLRAELRGYFTAMDSESQISCGGGCNIRYKGTGFNQYQFNTGLVFRF